MKKSTCIFALILFLTLSIYASPANNSLEVVATFCHFSDIRITCTCPEEAKEYQNEQKKLARKVRRDSTCTADSSCSNGHFLAYKMTITSGKKLQK